MVRNEMKKEIVFSLKKTQQVSKSYCSLSDICAVHGAPNDQWTLIQFDIDHSTRTITAIQILKELDALYPDYSINSMGCTKIDIFISQAKQNRAVTLLKTIVLGLVMFFGGAIAIMTFHEDVNMRAVHSSIYNFFTGVKAETVPVVSIPYSIGIAIGFIVLYGLFKRKNAKPTTLDLSLYKHDNDVQNYMSSQRGPTDE